MKKNKLTVRVGTWIKFVSGTYEGKSGVITKVDWESKDEMAIYGFLHTVLLNDLSVAYIEKSEHFEITQNN